MVFLRIFSKGAGLIFLFLEADPDPDVARSDVARSDVARSDVDRCQRACFVLSYARR